MRLDNRADGLNRRWSNILRCMNSRASSNTSDDTLGANSTSSVHELVVVAMDRLGDDLSAFSVSSNRTRVVKKSTVDCDLLLEVNVQVAKLLQFNTDRCALLSHLLDFLYLRLQTDLEGLIVLRDFQAEKLDLLSESCISDLNVGNLLLQSRAVGLHNRELISELVPCDADGRVGIDARNFSLEADTDLLLVSQSLELIVGADVSNALTELITEDVTISRAITSEVLVLVHDDSFVVLLQIADAVEKLILAKEVFLLETDGLIFSHSHQVDLLKDTTIVLLGHSVLLLHVLGSLESDAVFILDLANSSKLLIDFLGNSECCLSSMSPLLLGFLHLLSEMGLFIQKLLAVSIDVVDSRADISDLQLVNFVDSTTV